jgi:hypothetical protein
MRGPEAPGIHPIALGPREEATGRALDEAEDNFANLGGRERICALRDILSICLRAQGNPIVRDRAFAILARIAKSDEEGHFRGMALTAMGRVMLRDEGLNAGQWIQSLEVIEAGFQAQHQNPSLGFRASRELQSLATALGERMEPKLAMMAVDIAVMYLEKPDGSPNLRLMDALVRLSRNPGLDDEWFLGICTKVYVMVNRSNSPRDLAPGIGSITHLAVNRRCAPDLREEMLELVRNHAQAHPNQDIRHMAYYWLAFATLNDRQASGHDIRTGVELMLKNPGTMPNSDTLDAIGLWSVAREDGSDQVRFNAVRAIRAILEHQDPPDRMLRRDIGGRLPVLLATERSRLVRDEAQRLLSELDGL